MSIASAAKRSGSRWARRASAPEELVQRLVGYFRDRGVADVSELEVVSEDVRFMLPKPIRQALAAQA